MRHKREDFLPVSRKEIESIIITLLDKWKEEGAV